MDKKTVQSASLNKIIKSSQFIKITLLVWNQNRNYPLMSIEKHLPTRPYLKRVIDSPEFQYRVRNISKNQSMKQLCLNTNSKKDFLAKIYSKYTPDTSFFLKENINTLQVNYEQDLPKYSLENQNKLKQSAIKRNPSHRILRKASSCMLLPKSIASITEETSLKSSFMKNNERKVSLKKKVDFIKKRHNQEKSQGSETLIPQFQSQNFICDNKKSRPKLKLLVRDPFNASKAIHERKKAEMFDQSKIQNLNNTSMISEANRQEFQEFLSCLN